jgi:hypothetical protein
MGWLATLVLFCTFFGGWLAWEHRTQGVPGWRFWVRGAIKGAMLSSLILAVLIGSAMALLDWGCRRNGGC